MSRRWLGVAPLLALTACEALVAPGSFDQPMYRFEGGLFPSGALSESEAARARIGVLWSDPFQQKLDVPMPATHIESVFHLGAQGGETDRFSVDLYRPPPPEVLIEVTTGPPENQRAVIAIGEIVLFEDANGDGAFTVTGPRATITPADKYLAGSLVVLRYIAEPFPQPNLPMASSFPLGPVSARGYDAIGIVCEGPQQEPRFAIPFVTPAQISQIDLILQRSPDVFPEVRTCLRTHSP